MSWGCAWGGRVRGVSAQTKPANVAGMVVANVDNFQRPGAASMASIDVLSQEVEEMELEEAQSHQAAYHQQVRAATAPPGPAPPGSAPPGCRVVSEACRSHCSLRWCKSA